MKTILISGASGIVGYGILKSLKQFKKKLKLIGTTIYEDSIAQGFCDIFEKAVATNQETYIDWLLSIIEKYKVDLIIPGIEADMYKWLVCEKEIIKKEVKILLNNRELVSLCKDKWLFYEELIKRNEKYAIKTSLNSNYFFLIKELGFPFLLKPREGFGSKGIVIIEDKKTFFKYKKDIGEKLMAQQIVGNDEEEYTISVFGDGLGSYFCYQILKRKLSKEGFTNKAEVILSDNFNQVLTDLCYYFKPEGPTNFQFRKDKKEIKLLEINPRISSSTSIRTAFGYNESKMAIEYYLENKIPIQPIIKKGKAIRYMEDFIFYENRDNF